MRRIVLAVLLVLLGTSSACDRKGGSEPGAARDETPDAPKLPTAADTDREIQGALDAPLTAEARQWLAPANTKHVMWKTWDKPEARKQVDALYAAGAKKVWATDPTEVNGAQVVAQFVVELPTDPTARKRVFEWVAEWEKQIEDDQPTADVGQKYYEINLDL